MVIKAIYENGVFKPLEKVSLEERAEVDVHPRVGQGENGGKPKKGNP